MLDEFKGKNLKIRKLKNLQPPYQAVYHFDEHVRSNKKGIRKTII